VNITNPNQDRALIASIGGVFYEIPAGESIEVDDYVVASTLVEYGAKAEPAELQAARELWAERNRGLNSRTASASASEGAILGRQQATVDVATGTVASPGEPLRGAALDAAIKEANASGAGITATKAEEKRTALAAWQASRGSSSPVEQTRSDEFVTDENGNLKLDDEGQPIPVAGPLDVDAANVQTVNEPAETVSANPSEVDGVDTGEARQDTSDEPQDGTIG
jgi:hypothetical protein